MFYSKGIISIYKKNTLKKSGTSMEVWLNMI